MFNFLIGSMNIIWNKPWVIAGFIYLLAVIAIFFVNNGMPQEIDNEKGHCYFSDKMRGYMLEGVVLEKYSDKSNHMTPSLKIGGSQAIAINNIGEDSGFFRFVEVGDSLYKPSGSLGVKIFRDTMEIVWELKYGQCE